MHVVDAIEKACFTALSAAVTGAGVYSHAPKDSAYPMVIVGDIEEIAPIADTRFDDADRTGVVTIIALTEGEARPPCTALVGQIETALTGKTLTEGKWTLTFQLLRLSATLAEDGLGYVGVVQLSLFALT